MREHPVTPRVLFNHRRCLLRDQLILNSLHDFGFTLHFKPEVSIDLFFHEIFRDHVNILLTAELIDPLTGFDLVFLVDILQELLLKRLHIDTEVPLADPLHDAGTLLQLRLWLCDSQVFVSLDDAPHGLPVDRKPIPLLLHHSQQGLLKLLHDGIKSRGFKGLERLVANQPLVVILEVKSIQVVEQLVQRVCEHLHVLEEARVLGQQFAAVFGRLH